MTRLSKILLGVGLLALLGLLVLRHQDLFDWWVLRVYEPSDEIVQLADRAAMSDDGRKYFYVSDPEINDKREFNENCQTTEKAFVLGCYSGNRIYILNVERQELDGIMEVTAAHEMLHAAYKRLSSRERTRIVELLEADFARLEDEKLISLIGRYEAEGGIESRRDELHSILPTQVEELSPELEEYFARYFEQRAVVVELYKQYEATFEKLHSQISSLQSDIERLKLQIDQMEGETESQQAVVASLNARLRQYREEGDTEAYNALVPEQNAAVNTYNNLVDMYRTLINQHNRRVDELNDIVLLQNDLVNSMDSSVVPSL